MREPVSRGILLLAAASALAEAQSSTRDRPPTIDMQLHAFPLSDGGAAPVNPATGRPEWTRDLVVAHAGSVLKVDVTRSGLRRVVGGAPDWKRWKLARAVRRAASRHRRRRS